LGYRILALFLFLFDEPCNGHDLVVTLDIDELYALRGTPDGANVVRLRSQNHALLSDQQQLVPVLDVRHPDHLAVSVRRRDVDDADAAARLDPVLLDFGPFAVPALGDGQKRAAGTDHFHRDHVVIVSQSDAADAVR